MPFPIAKINALVTTIIGLFLSFPKISILTNNFETNTSYTISKILHHRGTQEQISIVRTLESPPEWILIHMFTAILINMFLTLIIIFPKRDRFFAFNRWCLNYIHLYFIIQIMFNATHLNMFHPVIACIINASIIIWLSLILNETSSTDEAHSNVYYEFYFFIFNLSVYRELLRYINLI
jgi:hypothetical protein